MHSFVANFSLHPAKLNMKLKPGRFLPIIVNLWQWPWSLSQPLPQLIFNDRLSYPTSVRHPSKRSEFLKDGSHQFLIGILSSLFLFMPLLQLHHLLVTWERRRKYQVVTKCSFLLIGRKEKIGKKLKTLRERFRWNLQSQWS